MRPSEVLIANTYATGANNGANLTFENVNYYGGNTEADILSGVSTATGTGPDADLANC